MGCEVVVAGADPAAVAAVFEQWEDVFSLHRSGSELSRVNATPARLVALSDRFAETLEIALAAATETDGLVDPAFGHRDAVRLAGRIVSRPPGLELDLNGVVKALAVDEAASAIVGEGFVSAGGDLAVRGPVDVGLPGGGAVRVLAGGLATSGTTTRGRHLIDPATGRPCESPWEQVTVSGSTCLAADVAAKAAFLLGHDGPEWLDGRGLPGRFREAGGRVVCNAHWERSLVCT
jgi:thiamine biosynthesis lipoprotein